LLLKATTPTTPTHGIDRDNTNTTRHCADNDHRIDGIVPTTSTYPSLSPPYRRHRHCANNDHSIDGIGIAPTTAISCTKEHARQFCYKTRRYAMAYIALEDNNLTDVEHAMIEKFVKTLKTHLSAMDQDLQFIDSLVQEIKEAAAQSKNL
jgi:hypothetical protein